MSDFAFWRIRNYVGSAGETVEVRPAKEVRAMLGPKSGRKWLYRFPHDKRWRISRDKFMALLESAWELGKSGVNMNWVPAPKKVRDPSKNVPRYGCVEMQLRRAENDPAESPRVRRRNAF